MVTPTIPNWPFSERCGNIVPHVAHSWRDGLGCRVVNCPGVTEPAEPKLRYELLPPESMKELALAVTIGAEKHGDTDWLDNPRPVSHHIGSLLRHLYAFLAGEERDADGQHHLASVASRALMIIELTKGASNGRSNRTR